MHLLFVIEHALDCGHGRVSFWFFNQRIRNWQIACFSVLEVFDGSLQALGRDLEIKLGSFRSTRNL